MRIIAGICKGRTINGPKSILIRPVLDQVKESIFNILGPLNGEKVLDLFGGTGSLGLEALSRGAESATFVDDFPESLKLIRKNIDLCQFSDQAIILKARLPKGVTQLSKRGALFDIIFSDPPYDKDLVNPTLHQIIQEKILAPSGMVIIEHSPREPIAADSGLSLVTQKKYGQTLVSFLKGS